MSVIVTVRLQADPAALEAFAGGNRDHMRGIVDAARRHGLIAHRFYGTEDGHVMVVDEWPDADSFQRFFAEQRPQIEPLFGQAGMTAEPEVRAWRKLDTHDEVGWED
jgi:quinol monooxygenase YgiN